MKEYNESRLTDLLIEFDEMGFCPTTVCPHPEQYAIEWKEQIVKEIQKLQAENAELRERLEKAVELPCKVGDTVYEKGMYEGDVYKHRIRKIIFDAEKISFDCTAIGNSIFLTRAEAEARLKEIQGGAR